MLETYYWDIWYFTPNDEMKREKVFISEDMREEALSAFYDLSLDEFLIESAQKQNPDFDWKLIRHIDPSHKIIEADYSFFEKLPIEKQRNLINDLIDTINTSDNYDYMVDEELVKSNLENGYYDIQILNSGLGRLSLEIFGITMIEEIDRDFLKNNL